MARREITTPLDLKNLNNHNVNYEELYGLIDETDRRLSEDMWEEIKDANTMKMLEPVQTAGELPATAEDKSLITVIDEQKVYAYVHDEWQPFSEIDLDPFEPFKTELSEIVAAYESQIQNITQEVQTTKDSAIESIQSIQTQSESNINQTEQSAISSINKAQSEVESDIQAIQDEMTTQASDLTALFNDSMGKLTSKQDTALAEVDRAKQAAITEIEGFNNTDTSNWQKYKLTQDDGTAKSLSGADWSDTAQLDALESGEYYATSTTNPPVGASSRNAFISVFKRAGVRRIEFRPYNSNQVFIKRFYETWSDWEPVGGTKVVLFDGSASGVDSKISLSAPYDMFEYLFVSFSSTPGRQTKIYEAQISDGITINLSNVYDDASNAKTYEMAIDRTDLTTLTIANEISYSFNGTGSSDSTIVIEKIVGVK
ncbi:pyocin knob domain-containing protein [Mammaliicoccus sciuri]|uniref:pyocin knob domain-containing protein n=1 Tax=Mammaliicoccus sciuri TaxID=1296 RepID=UPI0021D3A0C0|nr:pyocin knob domain-containing protein [Mammaliicoccus sciuri]UXV14864.1 pyocin knob domain-containing protein [Mammaliicoccus sciuri]UXV25906.1 pyocin knob domain-containing protein [Mammaliicoccus sciuri]